MTSSIRSGTLEDESADEKASLKFSESGETAAAPKQYQKEVLLCLRPIRDGDKVDESLRFTPLTRDEGLLPLESMKDQVVSSSGGGGNNLDDKADSDKSSSTTPSNQSTSRASGSSSNDLNKKRPPKKRLLSATSVGTFSNSNEESPQKRAKTDSKGQYSGNPSETDCEKSVVESLMLMNKSKSTQ